MVKKTKTKNFKEQQRKKSLISFKIHNKIKKWTTKVIVIDFLITVFFFFVMLHGIYEVISSFSKWKSLLIIWVSLLLLLEIGLFAQSLKVLHKNVKIYLKNKKLKKK